MKSEMRRATAAPKTASPRATAVIEPDDVVLSGLLEQVAAGAGPHRREHRVVVLGHRQHHDTDPPWLP